jgi:hypothetical protein
MYKQKYNMKKTITLILITFYCTNGYAQLNASQIKKDGVTIVANSLNQIVCDTVNKIATKFDVASGGGGGGSGTVTSVGTGIGLTGGTITTTGTISLDTASSVVLSRERAANTYQIKGNYLTTIDTATAGTGLVNKTRLSNSLGDYLQKSNNLSDVANRTTAVANLGTIYKFLMTDALSASLSTITITDGLSPWEWAVNANDIYIFEAWMVLTTSGSSGVNFRVNAPNDSQVSFSCMGSGGSASNVSQSTINAAVTLTATLVSYTSSSSAVMIIRGSVICSSTGGVINIQYRDSNPGQSVQAKAGGWLRITKVN